MRKPIEMRDEATARAVEDYSKIEAGRLELESIALPPRDLAEEICDLLHPAAQRKGVGLSCVVDSDVPHHVCGDPTRLRQVITNLLGNAVKFTARGEIRVTLKVVPNTGPPPWLRFEIADTGPGIADETRRRLFQPFSQADSSTTRRFGGTGLGLAICKRLVDLMSGEIGVDSEPGKGSRFWFAVPLAPVVDKGGDAAATLHGRRALVVGESNTNRRAIEQQVTSWHIELDVAETAKEALAALRAAARSGAPFDFVLIDAAPGGEDPLALVRAIRSRTAIAKVQLIVVGLRREDRARAEALGVVILPKPVRQSRLVDCLAQAVAGEPRTAAGSESPIPEVANATRGHVLLAEDNRVNQRVALLLLRKLGYTADLATNGREAIDAVERRLYDLVLMDCQMPEMDGYEATAEIRRRFGDRHLPIVAMTANAMQGDRQRCLDAGMDDYVSKPVREEELAAVLVSWIASAPAVDDNTSSREALGSATTS